MSLLEKIEKISDKPFPHLKEHSIFGWVMWREAIHVAGSIGLIAFTHLLRYLGWGSAHIFIFIALVLFITYKEFRRDPRLYHQRLYKGVADWIGWLLPFVLYFLIFQHV
jgi:hypothetical protein